MITRLCHELMGLFYSGSVKKFAASLGDVESTQRQRLSEIMTNLQATARWGHLAGKSYEELCELLPAGKYADFSSDILEQQRTGAEILAAKVIRFEPTSGSTEARKWLPYSQEFLNELNRAAAIWLGDIYKNYPEVKSGTHYWSLSWLPEELRNLTSSNDAELFPAYQRWILQNTMAVSPRLAHLESADAAWWATLVSLAANRDLSLVSVWSPTFWLKITKDLKELWSEVELALLNGQWGRHSAEIEKILGPAPRRQNLPASTASDFFKKLWPRLALISAWDSSSSHAWAREIKSQFPDVVFQGKGLWATEGVLTVPFQNHKVLATNAHFYEFRDLETNQIHPAWDLLQGRVYQPILWTSAGLLRYQLQDRVKVTGFLGKTPALEFLGRLQSVDLVGEKVDAQWVQTLFAENTDWKAFCLVACHKPAPHYILIHESNKNIDIESELQKLHHYKVARELGQLHQARSLEVKDVFHFFSKAGRSQVLGQNKIEILLEMESLQG